MKIGYCFTLSEENISELQNRTYGLIHYHPTEKILHWVNYIRDKVYRARFGDVVIRLGENDFVVVNFRPEE